MTSSAPAARFGAKHRLSLLSPATLPRHPYTLRNEEFLGVAREKLARAEAPVARRTRSSKAEES